MRGLGLEEGRKGGREGGREEGGREEGRREDTAITRNSYVAAKTRVRGTCKTAECAREVREISEI